eukprot:m51a1_g5189 hypothetical protein (634) ;mRNA; f:193976-196048
MTLAPGDAAVEAALARLASIVERQTREDQEFLRSELHCIEGCGGRAGSACGPRAPLRSDGQQAAEEETDDEDDTVVVAAPPGEQRQREGEGEAPESGASRLDVALGAANAVVCLSSCAYVYCNAAAALWAPLLSVVLYLRCRPLAPLLGRKHIYAVLVLGVLAGALMGVAFSSVFWASSLHRAESANAASSAISSSAVAAAAAAVSVSAPASGANASGDGGQDEADGDAVPLSCPAGAIGYWACNFVPAAYPVLALYVAVSSALWWRVVRARRCTCCSWQLNAAAASVRRLYRIGHSGLVPVRSVDDSPDVEMHINPDLQGRADLARRLGLRQRLVSLALDPSVPACYTHLRGLEAFVVKVPQRASTATVGLFLVKPWRRPGLGDAPRRPVLVVVAREVCSLLEGRLFSGALEGPEDVLARALYRVVSLFESQLRMLSLGINDTERSMVNSVNNKLLLRIFDNAKNVSDLHLGALGNAGVLEKAQRRYELHRRAEEDASADADVDAEGRAEDDGRKTGDQRGALRRLVEDIAMENEQCCSLARVLDDTSSGMMDARASIVANNLSVVMVNLNSLSFALAVPMLATSLGASSVLDGWIGPDPARRAIAYSCEGVLLFVIAGGLFFGIKRYWRWW